MKVYNLKVSRFLSWYFDTSDDQTQKEMILDLGLQAKESLFKEGSFQISVANLFSGKDSVESMPLHFLEDHPKANTDLEVGDVYDEIEIKLIN
jgi:hypothetical protein